MKSDWEQYLEKRDRREKTTKKVGQLIVAVALIGMIAWSAIGLMPERIEDVPESREYTANDDGIVFTWDNGDTDAIQITSCSTSGDAIEFTVSTDGIEITND